MSVGEYPTYPTDMGGWHMKRGGNLKKNPPEKILSGVFFCITVVFKLVTVKGNLPIEGEFFSGDDFSPVGREVAVFWCHVEEGSDLEVIESSQTASDASDGEGGVWPD